ncbi:MAG: GTPase ObgE [Dehalococcoidales bacterium]|nr:GTPase ObgE [Dehalococcoidales bacterium]
MFDHVLINVEAGAGGDGAISFRREKYVPFGGPDGGDGGDGGDVIVEADPGVTSLNAFQQGRRYRADDGENGRGKKKHGKNGDDLVLRVPVGTVIFVFLEKAEMLADLEAAGQRATVAVGGRGGWGNIHFASPINQAPLLAQKGEAGEEKTITLELRLIADVGIIGYPNVGKSTLLAAASAAKPKIANYPFTTLEPILGNVVLGQKSFVLAEIPGLIEGAHLGRGLGHDFLRHAMRTRALIHLIEGESQSPVEDMAQVNAELAFFDSAMAKKPQIVAVNKIDLPQVRARVAAIKEAFAEVGVSVSFVAAATGEGVSEIMAKAMKALDRMTARSEIKEEASEKVFHPQPRESSIRVRKEGNVFVIESPYLERIVSRVEMTNPEVRGQFRQQLDRRGITSTLKKAGIKPGDKVRCGEFEWEW